MPVKAAAREPKGFKFPDGQFVPWGIQDSEFIKSLQGKVIDLDGFKKISDPDTHRLPTAIRSKSRSADAMV